MSYLKPSWTPVHKADAPFQLREFGDGGLDIFGGDIATEQETRRHVLATELITADHLVGVVKTGQGYSVHSFGLVLVLKRD